MPGPASPAPTPRDWWLAFEPVHAVVYFDDGCRRAMEEAGMRGFWMGYFAGRAAPLGPVGPGPVEATFFNFQPERVRRAIPDAWAIADPVRIWQARRDSAAACLRRVDPDVERRADAALPMLERVVAAAVGAGRPLFAATRDVPDGDDPVAALWQTCTALREHRGDGHVAALTASGLDGVEALVLFAASEGLPASLLQAARGWSDDEWDAAAARLRARGLVDGGGILPPGTELRRSVEASTDEQAARPLAVLDDRERSALLGHLRAVSAAVADAGVIRYPNPMGLPGPSS